MPSRLASSTSFSIARWVSRASVGCAIAFSCTVVSIATRSRSLVSIAPVRWATERLSCNSATICSSPSRWRQRVSDERSNGSSCRNTTSPQKYWNSGFSPDRSHSASSERLCIGLRRNSPATSRVSNGGCPGPTRHTELKRRARKSQSISPASRTSGWRRLMISSRGGRKKASLRSARGRALRLPPHPKPPAREKRTPHTRTAQSGNPKPQENRHAYPAFLQNRLLAQVKSSRSINRFLILHGRQNNQRVAAFLAPQQPRPCDLGVDPVAGVHQHGLLTSQHLVTNQCRQQRSRFFCWSNGPTAPTAAYVR